MTKVLQQYQYALILKEIDYEKHYWKLFENPDILHQFVGSYL